MESVADKLRRLLAGVSVTLFLLTGVALLDGRMSGSDSSIGMIFLTIAILAGFFSAILRFVNDWPHGSFPTDRWFSRENELEMSTRLEQEMVEASIENMGTAWAKMEIQHLESKNLGEE